MTLLRTHHVQIMIPHGHEKEAREFYIEFLGLTEIPKPDPLAGSGGFWLDLEGFQVHVGVGGKTGSNSRQHIAFVVDSLKSWRSRLLERSILIKDGTSIPGLKRLEFRDPFNNRLEFLEELES